MKKKDIAILHVKTVRGTIVLVTREFLMKGLAIIGQFLLIKFILPDAFGAFAILSFLIGSAEIFTDIGLNISIIQRKLAPTKNQLSSIFFLKIFLTASVALLLIACAPFLTHFSRQFHSSEVFMLQVLALGLFLEPLQNMQIALLERNLRYREISHIDIAGLLSYYMVAIILALHGFALWSFIWAVIAKNIVEGIVAFFHTKWLPGLHWNYPEIRDMITIGKYFQLGFILTFVHNGIIPILGGRFTTISQVGFLDWSFNMSSFPRVFVDNLGRVSFTSYSRIQDNKQAIVESVEQSFELLSILTIFIVALMIGFGHDIIHFFLSDRWLPALPALYWYVSSILFLNGTATIGNALLAIGKAKKIISVSTILIIFEIIISLTFLKIIGFTGIAIGFFLSTFLTFIVYLLLFEKENMHMHIASKFFSKILLLLFSIGFVLLINHILFSSMLLLFVKVFLTGIFYLLLLSIFSPGSLRIGKFFIMRIFQKEQ